MIDLSVIILARNEEFLGRTIQDVLEHAKGNTDIIVVLDGYLPDPPLKPDPRITIIYNPVAVGQRAASNQAAKIAKGKYVMKVDAHCAFDDGFDVKMLEAFKETGDNVTMIPMMRNLHVFDWVCPEGHRRYQGLSGPCYWVNNGKEWIYEEKGKDKGLPICGKPTVKDIVWIPKKSPTTHSFRFDKTLHFQYHGELSKHPVMQKGVLTSFVLSFDTRTVPSGIIGFLTDFANSHLLTCRRNELWFRQNVPMDTVGLSPVHSSRSIGTSEILGVSNELQVEGVTTSPIITKMVNNENVSTPTSGDTTNQPSISDTMCEFVLSQVSETSIAIFGNSANPFPTGSSLVNAYTAKKLNSVLGGEFIYNEKTGSLHNGSVTLTPIYVKDLRETMSIQGSCFMLTKEKYFELDICSEEFHSWGQQGVEVACKTWLSGGRVIVNMRTWYAHMFRTKGGDFGFPYSNPQNKVNENRELSRELFQRDKWPLATRKFQWLLDKFNPPDWGETRGAIFYTDSQLDERIGKPIRDQIIKAVEGKNISITSASLRKLDFGNKNVRFPTQKRGHATMFKQILGALEKSTDDYVFFLEHDVWYSPSHFDFVPEDKNIFYFNNNVWKVDLLTGKAVKVDKCEQLSGMCVWRETALKWVREKYNQILSSGFDRHFEPQNTVRGSWESQQPNIDIRHDGTQTPSRWSKDQFRNQENTKGWTEAENKIPEWGDIRPILNLMR